MNKPLLILVSGKKQSGKNVVGNYLKTFYDFKEMSFAYKLKERVADALSALTGLSKDGLLQGFEKEAFKNSVISYMFNKKKRTYREYLQHYGTEWNKSFFNDSLWAEELCNDILYNNTDIHKPIVITDCRFGDEISTVKLRLSAHYDIVTFRINRKKNLTIKEWFFNLFKKEHISETALDKYSFDYVIDNKYDLDYVYTLVDSFLIKRLVQ